MQGFSLKYSEYSTIRQRLCFTMTYAIAGLVTPATMIIRNSNWTLILYPKGTAGAVNVGVGVLVPNDNTGTPIAGLSPSNLTIVFLRTVLETPALSYYRDCVIV